MSETPKTPATPAQTPGATPPIHSDKPMDPKSTTAPKA
jgi:hypothetical protein